MNIENEDIKKRAFAVALLKNPSNSFLAAMAVEPDTGKALFISQTWVGDADVLAYQAEIVEEFGEDLDLPTKAQTCRLILERARTAIEDSDFKDLMKLYCDVRNYIEKPQTNINNNIISANKVMIVKDHGTNDDWRIKAAQQQKQLMNASAKRIN